MTTPDARVPCRATGAAAAEPTDAVQKHAIADAVWTDLLWLIPTGRTVTVTVRDGNGRGRASARAAQRRAPRPTERSRHETSHQNPARADARQRRTPSVPITPHSCACSIPQAPEPGCSPSSTSRAPRSDSAWPISAWGSPNWARSTCDRFQGSAGSWATVSSEIRISGRWAARPRSTPKPRIPLGRIDRIRPELDAAARSRSETPATGDVAR